MLALISFDSISRPLFERMIAHGDLPNCAELMRRAKTLQMESTPFRASFYRALYPGFILSTHGFYYPFTWNASAQRVEPARPMDSKDPVFARRDRAGGRFLFIDPP